MSQEIELYSKLQNPVTEIRELGKMVARSGMFGCDREETGCAIVMMSWMDRMTLTQWSRTYDLVEGKARKKALACLAEFRAGGGKFRWLSSGDTPAAKEEDRYAELELVDREGNKLTYRYSMADARAEGLVKDKSRWVKRPGNMLRARCISNGLGMLAPEIFAGDDSDSEAPAVPPPTINLAPATTVTAPPPPPPTPEPPAPPVIDVESEKVEAEMGLAPVQEPNPVEQMGIALQGNFLPAAKWLVKEGWIKAALAPDATEVQAGAFLQANLSSLTPGRVKRILTQKESFLRAIGGAA